MSQVRVHRLVSMAVACVMVFSISGVALAQWSDDFEDYDPDTGVSGQGDWESWDQDPGVDADVSSGPQLDALCHHDLEAPIDHPLFELDVGDAVAQQPAGLGNDTVLLLLVVRAVQILGSAHKI